MPTNALEFSSGDCVGFDDDLDLPMMNRSTFTLVKRLVIELN